MQKADVQDGESWASAFCACQGMSGLIVTLYEFYMGNTTANQMGTKSSRVTLYEFYMGNTTSISED